MLDPQKDLSKLNVSNYGDVSISISAKASVKTQTLNVTNYGMIVSSNEYVTSASTGKSFFALLMQMM